MWGQNFFSNERCSSMSSKENDADEKTGDANKRKATIFKGKVFEGVKGDGIHTRGRGHWPQEQGHGIHATRKDRGTHGHSCKGGPLSEGTQILFPLLLTSHGKK